MKHRAQIISETLHSINKAIDVLREAEQDLHDCDIATLQLHNAINDAARFALAVQAHEDAAKASRLREPMPRVE